MRYPRGFSSQTSGRMWAIAFSLAVAFLYGCDGGADPISWEKIIPAPTPNTASTIRASNHLVVYLDTSGSMAGYVSPDGQINFAVAPDGQTVFSHVLQELRNVVTTLNPPADVVFRRVASNVEPPLFSDLELGQASINRSVYTGAETNLAGAINLFPAPLQAKPRGASAKDDGQSDGEEEPPPALFHILVTDGVQSTKQQRVDGSCTAGSDYVCVKKAISGLLEKGWGGSVIGIRSEFHGKVFSEINRGQALQYASRKSDSKTFRPFYLYVFSPDREALDRLVEALKARLRTLLKQEDPLREYALTSHYSNGAGSAEIIIPKESADYLERTRAKEENPPRLTLRIDVDTEKKGPQPFDIAVNIPWSGHARDAGTLQELAGLLRWELLEVLVESPKGAERARHPEIKLNSHQPDEQGRVVVRATAHWPQGTGAPGWKAYRLVGRLDLEKQTPPWVKRWSTDVDTTANVADRTLNLEIALAGLWNNSATRSQVIAEVYLRVGPQ